MLYIYYASNTENVKIQNPHLLIILYILFTYCW